jgi:hypothetical protein
MVRWKSVVFGCRVLIIASSRMNYHDLHELHLTQRAPITSNDTPENNIEALEGRYLYARIPRCRYRISTP